MTRRPVPVNRELPLNSCIQLLLQDELAAVDFKNVEKVTNQINQWVNEKTRKKIPNLLPAGSLDSSTKMALVNAAYFKGNFTVKVLSFALKPDFYPKAVLKNFNLSNGSPGQYRVD